MIAIFPFHYRMLNRYDLIAIANHLWSTLAKLIITNNKLDTYSLTIQRTAGDTYLRLQHVAHIGEVKVPVLDLA